jgi:pimeloyl-ACP methyl ester carboxylesterase
LGKVLLNKGRDCNKIAQKEIKMNIVLCHGVMGPEEDWNIRAYNQTKKWKDWLQFYTEFEHDVITQKPYFPHAHVLLMKYDEWEKIMDHQDINSDTVLVGHSAGGGFVLKYLALHPELRVRQVVLVAPWIDVEGFQPFGFYCGFDLDDSIVARAGQGIDVMISDDDFSYITDSVDKIVENMPSARIHRFTGRGHFTGTELPEIMQIIKW